MILFLHRKDLRTSDLAAFYYIAQTGVESLHLFILDPEVLAPDRHLEPSGIAFLRHLVRLQREYTAAGRLLHIRYGSPEDVVRDMLDSHPIRELVWQTDHSPYAASRDSALRRLAAERGVAVTAFADQTLIDPAEFQAFARREEPYKVFTPFYRKWSEYLALYAKPPYRAAIADLRTVPLRSDDLPGSRPPFDLADFQPADNPADELAVFLDERLGAYAAQRDRYSIRGTSGLSSALNCGALSVRAIDAALSDRSAGEAWRRQLAWRDFYMYQALYDPAFFSYEHRYDWSGLDDTHFQAWRRAETGIPIIDAAMTQLGETGELPNRLRMVTAMFLTKNLLCPFPLGERYFRLKLADADCTLNRGGWLWCASLGFDAAPYFRIMNPVSQSETHDPAGDYIRRWLPSLAHKQGRDIHQPLPHAIVDLKASRARAIEVYRTLLASGSGGSGEASGEHCDED